MQIPLLVREVGVPKLCHEWGLNNLGREREGGTQVSSVYRVGKGDLIMNNESNRGKLRFLLLRLTLREFDSEIVANANVRKAQLLSCLLYIETVLGW